MMGWDHLIEDMFKSLGCIILTLMFISTVGIGVLLGLGVAYIIW